MGVMCKYRGVCRKWKVKKYFHSNYGSLFQYIAMYCITASRGLNVLSTQIRSKLRSVFCIKGLDDRVRIHKTLFQIWTSCLQGRRWTSDYRIPVPQFADPAACCSSCASNLLPVQTRVQTEGLSGTDAPQRGLFTFTLRLMHDGRMTPTQHSTQSLRLEMKAYLEKKN